MHISEHLDTLACPLCKGKLDVTPECGKLLCRRCDLGFRIKEGIPLLLADAAEKTLPAKSC